MPEMTVPTAGGRGPDRDRVRPRSHRLHLAEVVPLADRRGLTAAGAVAIALGFGAFGGFIDVLTGQGLRATFAIFFVVGCALAAALAHREDLYAVIVMPPLCYLLLALVADVIDKAQIAGSWLSQQFAELLSALVLQAPVLLVATALAAAIATARRRRDRPAAPGGAPARTRRSS